MLLDLIDKDFLNYNIDNIKNFDICINCKNSDLTIWEYDNPYIVCKNCGVIQRYVINKNSLYDDSIKFTIPLHYKRINYLKELINSINLQYADTKNEKINNIFNLLIQNNIGCNYKNIRLFLKKNNLNFLYNQIYYIMYLFDKSNYKTIDFNTKNKIINKFIEIESIYKNIQKFLKRKKMLNYQFILYKIFYIIGCSDLIIYLNYPFLSNLKTIYHNDIFDRYFKII